MAVEHNFARGDILRKVLERTGITAGRPLNLRRGGSDALRGAELLRKLRGFDKHAGLLAAMSTKLDDLIEFRAYPEAVMRTVWNKIKKPSRKTFGKIMKRHDPRSPIPTMVFRDQPHMMAAKDYVTKYPKSVLESVWKKIKKPRPSSPIAPSFHSGEYHDTPKWVNKDIKKSRQENLSAKLNELIQFQDPRPRNPLGEFQPQGEGGPDPNAMATVYKMPQQKGPSVMQGAGGALVGGALGAVGGNIGKTGWAASRKAIKQLAAKRKGVSRIVKP